MSEPSRVVLQLNLPALERLLGNDTPLEVELREQVVNNFAEKHLKALANSEAFRAIEAEWRRDLTSEIAGAVAAARAFAAGRAQTEAKHDYGLRQAVADAVKAHVEAIVEDRFNAWVAQTMQGRVLAAARAHADIVAEALLGEIVQKAVAKALDAAIVSEVEARVDRLVRAALESRFAPLEALATTARNTVPAT